MALGRDEVFIVSSNYCLVSHNLDLFSSVALRHVKDQLYQLFFAGPEINYMTLKTQASNIAALQEEFNRITGRKDIIFKSVTNWQGEWRSVCLLPRQNLENADYFLAGLIYEWPRNFVLAVYLHRWRYD